MKAFVDTVRAVLESGEFGLTSLKHVKLKHNLEFIDAAKQAMRHAVCFSATDEYSRMAAEASLLKPRVLMQLLNHSAPPARPMFIEWNQHVVSEYFHSVGHGRSPLSESTPTRQGALILGELGPIPGSTAVLFTNELGGSMLPNCVHWTHDPESLSYRDWVKHSPLVNQKTSEIFDSTFYSGLKSNYILTDTYMLRHRTNAENPELKEFCSRAHMVPSPIFNIVMASILNGTKDISAEHIEDANKLMCQQQAGIPRLVVSLLGLMNVLETRLSEPQRAGQGRFLHHRRSYPYSSFRTVDILVPNLKKPRSLEQQIGTGIKRKFHTVREHYRRYRNADGTIRREIKIAEHGRGDANLGTVVKNYRIKAPA